MVAVVVAAPLVQLGFRALGSGPGRALEVLTRERTLELLVRSVALTATVVVLCLVLGVGAAWLTTSTDLPGRRGLAVALTVPLAVPSYVAGYLWISEVPALAGFAGATLVLTVSSYPYVMLPVAAALLRTDPSLADAARTLGRSRLRTTLTVTLRQVVPAAAAGGLLVALYVLSDFGAVALMRYETFTTGIYASYRGSFSRVPAAVLGCVLVTLALVVTLLERRARRGATHRVGPGTARRPAPVALRAWRWPAVLAPAALVAVGVAAPLVSLVGWLFRSRGVDLDLARVLGATGSTVTLGVLAAALVAVCALPAGFLAARSRSRVTRAVEVTSYVGHALPGITVGLALVFLGIRVLPALYQRTPMLLLGYLVLFLPLAVGTTRAAVAAASPRLEEVSATLGVGRTATGLRVLAPLVAPGVLAGAALVFLTVAKELPMTLLLRPTTTSTLATELWTQSTALSYGAAAPYALGLVVVSTVPALLLSRAVGARP